MAIRTGKVIIAKNIKLDKNYKDVLTYTESQMLTLVNSKKVAELSSCSFVRPDKNIIDTGFSYETALKCNYMAMQNPLYSNKWFFAFIDDVEYISNGNARIHYTIDEFSTWWDYWNPKACFVIREHVSNDAFGLHTVPENLETGEYISTKLQPTTAANFDTCFCIASSEKIVTGYSTLNENLPTGLYYTGFTTLQGVKDAIDLLTSNKKADSINSVFVIPKQFFSNFTTVSGINGQVSATVRFTTNLTDISVTRVTYLGNEYYPKNNKLLCYPYSFLQVSNHNGTIANYEWENFNLLLGQSGITFQVGGALTPGGSFVAYPIDYKNILNNVDEGITLGKYPVGGWNTDAFTNWLASNGVNVALGVVGGAVALGLAIPTAGSSLAVAGAIATGGISIASSVASVYQHSLAPDQARGNTNIGDFTFGFSHLNLDFKRISIKEEYAKIIDDYFERFGYKVNTIKLPNQTGRHYWNYVQIGAEECIGYSTVEERSVPSSSMELINNIYRSGVTLWHDHDQLGNYNLRNNIL